MFRSKELKDEVYGMYDDVLESWPGSVTKKFVETPYGKTYVVEVDNGHSETLVLLHGMLANLCMWNPLIQHFSKSYNLLILDIPLEPGKSEASKLFRNNNDAPDWFKSVIDELNLESLNLVGGSFGGWIGLKYANENPQIVKSLTIVSPHPIRGPVIWSKKPWIITWFVLLLLVFPKIKYAEKMLDELYSTKSKPNKLDYKLFTTSILASKMRAAPSAMSAKFLSKITCPTLLLVGDSDINFDKAKLEQCVKYMPNATYEIVEDAGHMLLCEKPDHVSIRIHGFLEAIA